MAHLEFSNVEFLYNILLPSFNSLKFHTKKKKDFIDWSIIVKLYYFGYHLLLEGKSIINNLKKGINNYRLFTFKDLTSFTSSIKEQIDKIFSL